MTNRLGEEAESRLRSLDEIQAAHDRLVAILLSEVPDPFPEHRDLTTACAAVLCWVLSHEHNTEFERVIRGIDAFLQEKGFELRKGHP